ncbi:MAG: Glu/Leu/Phe/Val dehydrogenase [Deltaproteobacteria bacterium]|nr:Glu/Leu/Phe/Val dehydrogenase [Deltaproteobacteria bacterium]
MSTTMQVELFERINPEEYQSVIFCNDRRVGLKAIIAIHNSNLGPGTGGCRMYPYKDTTAAVEDVLRLSKGMSYKAAISGLKLGGAKAVIIGNPKTDKTPELLKRFGQFVENLHGQYITAKDVGITGEDLMMVREQTRHILGIEGLAGSSGDPSPMTAFGVFNGMKAAARHAFGEAALKGKRIAVQGLGYVSYSLVRQLVNEGASVVGADVDNASVARFQREFGIDIVSPDNILAEKCDILSPNALGAVINAQSIPQIQAKVIAGAANNQLATDEDGFELMRRGIVYAPDYAINAGGLINIYHERGGYDAARAMDHTGGIYRTIEEVLARADKENLPPHRIADRIAEERIAAGSAAIKG